MARPYFRQIPDFGYVNRNKNEKEISNYLTVKNLFKRGKLRKVSGWAQKIREGQKAFCLAWVA